MNTIIASSNELHVLNTSSPEISRLSNNQQHIISTGSIGKANRTVGDSEDRLVIADKTFTAPSLSQNIPRYDLGLLVDAFV